MGVDVQDVSDVEESLHRFGIRYLTRFLTAREIATCDSAGEISPQAVALHFAVKEATVKALREFADECHWLDFEISTSMNGCAVSASPDATDWLGRVGARGVAVSGSVSAQRAWAWIVVNTEN